MENAVDALKIAFAVMVFVMSFSLAMFLYNKAMDTSKIVLHSSDITSFIEYKNYDDMLYSVANPHGIVNERGNRIVGLETIIPTLYKYYKENYTVIFRNVDGTYMTLYRYNERDLWPDKAHQYESKYMNVTPINSVPIYSFDISDETARFEPWTKGSSNSGGIRKFLSAFLSGQEYHYTVSGTSTNPTQDRFYDFSNGYASGSFIQQYSGRKFVESVGEHEFNIENPSEDLEQQQYNSGLLNGRKKRVIVYTLLP